MCRLLASSCARPAGRSPRLIPSTKQIESRMLDLPDPFSPVIAVNWESKGPTVVRIE